MKKAGILSILFVVVMLAVAVIAEAQQPTKVSRIGYLTGASLAAVAENIGAFLRGLRDVGYVEGYELESRPKMVSDGSSVPVAQRT